MGNTALPVGHVDNISPYEELAATNNGHQRCLFVDHYVMDPSSARLALIAAGYVSKNATQRAWKFMSMPLIAAAVAQKLQEKMERTSVTADRVLNELAIVGFSNLEHYDIDPATGYILPVKGVPDYVMRAVSSIKFTVISETDPSSGAVITTRKTEFRLWDKMAALTLMAKHLGMLTELHRVDINATVKQVWRIGDREVEF